MSKNEKPAEELAEYQQTTKPGYFDGRKLVRTHVNVKVPESHVPSVTWIPVNEPAKRAFAKRMAAHEQHHEAAAAAARMRDPLWLMQRIAEGGIDVSGLKKNLADDKVAREQAATIAELKAENEALKERAEREAKVRATVAETVVVPKDQGVAGAGASASPKK